MTADCDRSLKSRCLLVWGQLLLLSIICTFPAYATGENSSDTASVLAAKNTEIILPDHFHTFHNYRSVSRR